MRDRRPLLSVLLAIAVLGFSLVACVGGEPSIDDAVMAKSLDDQYKPVEETTAFSPTETFHCSVEVSNLEEGSKVTAKWFHGDELIDEETYTADKGGSGYVAFELQLEEGRLPIGNYMVEIYLDGELAKSIDFTVERPEALLGPIVFAEGVTEDYQPINPATTFPAGTTEVYAVFDYQGMSDGMEWEDKWYLEGEEVAPGTGVWDGDEGGTAWVTLYAEEGSLDPGNYKLELYVKGQLLQSGTFVIE